MRVQPRSDEKPASGFSWGDYEDVNVTQGAYASSGASRGGAEDDADGEGDDDNDSWGVVKSRKPSTSIRILFIVLPLTTQLPSEPPRDTSSQSQSNSQSQLSAAPSKRQRQNAAKRDAQKAAKASAEAERLATLAKHKRELEKAKMAEQFSGKKAQVEV